MWKQGQFAAVFGTEFVSAFVELLAAESESGDLDGFSFWHFLVRTGGTCPCKEPSFLVPGKSDHGAVWLNYSVAPGSLVFEPIRLLR